MENLLEHLNDGQREAVEYCDGASLVIAGAGSGKTRVLTYKIAYLLQERQMEPWHILALTFTNKAAREMKDRIARLVGDDRARYLQMGTFHAVFSRILRAEADKLGFAPNYTIYDQSDSQSLVKSIAKEMQLDDKVYKPSMMNNVISMAKNHLVLPQAFAQCSLYDSKKPKVADVYARYVERCKQANAMDFDDLLLNTYLLFENHEDVRRKYVDKFQFVLVDEYQDTNFAQQKIILQLTREHQHICVVGDDAQSIYSFRGANIDNILNFRESYDNAKLFKLERNYRSTQLIVQAANSLIKKNERQIPKDVYSKNDEGEKIVLKTAYSDKEEALIVCNEIQRIRRKEGCEYGDFAILYRTNSQSRSFEEQMRRMSIPYRIFGGLSFYQRKEIKDIIAYFRVVANPNDEEALKRIINYPTRGIGATTIGKIVETASRMGVSLWTVIRQPAMFQLPVNAGTQKKLDAFCEQIESWQQASTQQDVYALGFDIIAQSGIKKDLYSGRNPEDLARQENLEEFMSGMQDFVESRREEGMENDTYLTDFLQEVALLTDAYGESDEETSKVSLMTVHAAKGLEFPTVFVVGLEENIFPSPMSSGSMRELEEERRLLYVAITRAEKHCYLTCAQNRFRFGRMEYDTPSRFIRDIDPMFLRVDSGNIPVSSGGGSSSSSWMQNTHPVASQFKADPMPRQVGHRREEPAESPFSDQFVKQLNMAGGHFKPAGKVVSSGGSSADFSQIVAGVTVEHQRFGIGKVLSVEGTGENAKAQVQFRNLGTKMLLLKFAKLTVL